MPEFNENDNDFQSYESMKENAEEEKQSKKNEEQLKKVIEVFGEAQKKMYTEFMENEEKAKKAKAEHNHKIYEEKMKLWRESKKLEYQAKQVDALKIHPYLFAVDNFIGISYVALICYAGAYCLKMNLTYLAFLAFTYAWCAVRGTFSYAYEKSVTHKLIFLSFLYNKKLAIMIGNFMFGHLIYKAMPTTIDKICNETMVNITDPNRAFIAPTEDQYDEPHELDEFIVAGMSDESDDEYLIKQNKKK